MCCGKIWLQLKILKACLPYLSSGCAQFYGFFGHQYSHLSWSICTVLLYFKRFFFTVYPIQVVPAHLTNGPSPSLSISFFLLVNLMYLFTCPHWLLFNLRLCLISSDLLVLSPFYLSAPPPPHPRPLNFVYLPISSPSPVPLSAGEQTKTAATRLHIKGHFVLRGWEGGWGENRVTEM